MKRSFYELLGVTRNADQAQIHAAYARTMERLDTAKLHGTSRAGNEMRLIREGYGILSDQVERARYDTKLAASDAGMKFELYPKNSAVHRKLGIETIVLSVLSAMLGAVIHAMLAPKADEEFIEYQQAVAKQKGAEFADNNKRGTSA